MFAFDDRRPAARAHILVCPRAHVANTRSLAGAADAELVAHMRAVGRALLLERGTALGADGGGGAPARGARRGCCGLLPALPWARRRRRRGGGQLEGGLLDADAGAPHARADAAAGGSSDALGPGAPPHQSPEPHLFGFHKPPWRSVDHLHMHCFLLPLKPAAAPKYCLPLNWVTANALEAELLRGEGH